MISLPVVLPHGRIRLWEHEFELVVYEGEIIEIDQQILPLMKLIWEKGIRTRFCCQGGPAADDLEYEGAQIVFEEEADVLAFLNMTQPARWSQFCEEIR